MNGIQELSYSSDFSAKQYLQMYYCKKEIPEHGTTHFLLRLFSQFFKKYCHKWDGSSAKLLEFAGGAVIQYVISAAPHFAEIVHAVHTEDERREVELWKSEAEDAHNWTVPFKHVVCTIEGLGEDAAWQERAALLRSKIRVVGCDIYADNPIGPTDEPSPFSVICTSMALEAACKTYDDFKSAIKKLVKMLKLGGYIIIVFVEDETFYVVGEKSWPVLPVSLNQAEKALEEAGCRLLMSERDPSPIDRMENPSFSDEISCAFLAAYKVKSVK
jgi:hypothetical protein